MCVCVKGREEVAYSVDHRQQCVYPALALSLLPKFYMAQEKRKKKSLLSSIYVSTYVCRRAATRVAARAAVLVSSFSPVHREQ